LSIKKKLDDLLERVRKDFTFHAKNISVTSDEFTSIFGKNAEESMLHEFSYLNHQAGNGGLLLFEENGDWFYVMVYKTGFTTGESFYNLPVSGPQDKHIYKMIDEALCARIYAQEKRLEKQVSLMKKVTNSNKFRLNKILN
jgi:hypothetical protein